MPITNIVQQHFDQLVTLCQQYGVERLYVFGSAATGRFNEQSSDLDFIAEMQPMSPLERGENLMNFWTALEKLFGRKVDLLTDQPIKNPYFRKSVEATKQLIYDRASQKISV